MLLVILASTWPMMRTFLAALALRCMPTAALLPASSRWTHQMALGRASAATRLLAEPIVSPFDRTKNGGGVAGRSGTGEGAATFGGGGGGDDDDDDEHDDDEHPFKQKKANEPLPLTLENVETILDEMRPYLISDGGNVAVRDIDGPIVKLELQGACGSCPSSTMTMKMGLERRLKEAIPEIEEVVQAMPDVPDLTVDEVDTVLDGIRPFLNVAGGSIEVASLTGVDSLQPRLVLRLEGASSTVQSVKLEIMQRIQRHFMVSGLRVDWAEE